MKINSHWETVLESSIFVGRYGNSNYFNDKISMGNFFPDVHLFPSITGKQTRRQIISESNRFKSSVNSTYHLYNREIG